MSWTKLGSLISAFKVSLEKSEAETSEEFVVTDMKVEFPALLGALGDEVAVQLPNPQADLDIDSNYLSRITITVSPGPDSGSCEPLSPGSGTQGGAWELAPSGTQESLYDLWISGAGVIYIVGTQGTVLHSGDGLAFGPATAISSQRLHAVWGSGSGDVCAVGWKGTILRMPAPMSSWGDIQLDTQTTLNSLWADGSGAMAAVGEDGVLAISADNGKSWAENHPGLETDKYGVWGTAEYLFVVGVAGHVERFSRQDLNLNASLWSSGNRLYAIWGPTAQVLYAVGEKGTIVRSNDGGDSWGTVESGTTQHLYAIWGRGADDVYAVGRGGTVLRSTDGGDTWKAEQTPGDMALHAISGTSDGRIFCVGSNGSILRKIETWQGNMT